YDVLCLDEVDQVLGDRDREEGLFHLYHRVQEAGGRLVLAARQAPQNAEFALPDLASRLRAARVMRLGALDDDDLVRALKQRAERRDLELPDATARYLLNHYRRDMHSLCALLDELDLASLAARRRLTVPFVKDLI
ncbi:MAG: DnaA/Hda family protein, partial [Pseudomonadota bacterium]